MNNINSCNNSPAIDAQKLIGVLEDGRSVAEGWAREIRPTPTATLNARFEQASPAARHGAKFIFVDLFCSVTTPAAHSGINIGALRYASGVDLDHAEFKQAMREATQLAEAVMQARGFPGELQLSFNSGLVPNTINAVVEVVPRAIG